MVGFLVLAQAEFKRGDNDLTVIDTDTQLEWQDNSDVSSSFWSGAITYCHDLELDNKDDWRLPNINELKSIVLETQYAPTIDKKFKFTKNYRYWSSTRRKNINNHYWIINFKNGIVDSLYNTNNATYYSYIRCVRDAD